jgi:hypothetical protein
LLVAFLLIAETAEQERVFFRFRRFVNPIQVPKERVGLQLLFGAVFRTPDRPKYRIIPLDAFAGRQEWLQKCKNLQAFIAIVVLAGSKEREEIGSMQRGPGRCIFLDNIRIKEKKNARARPV